MAAVGSKILEQMEGDVRRFRHALDYAPGLDYPNIDVDDWGDMSKSVDELDKSITRSKKLAKCIEDGARARCAEDLKSYDSDKLREIIEACRRRK